MNCALRESSLREKDASSAIVGDASHSDVSGARVARGLPLVGYISLSRSGAWRGSSSTPRRVHVFCRVWKT